MFSKIKKLGFLTRLSITAHKNRFFIFVVFLFCITERALENCRVYALLTRGGEKSFSYLYNILLTAYWPVYEHTSDVKRYFDFLKALRYSEWNCYYGFVSYSLKI